MLLHLHHDRIPAHFAFIDRDGFRGRVDGNDSGPFGKQAESSSARYVEDRVRRVRGCGAEEAI